MNGYVTNAYNALIYFRLVFRYDSDGNRGLSEDELSDDDETESGMTAAEIKRLKVDELTTLCEAHGLQTKTADGKRLLKAVLQDSLIQRLSIDDSDSSAVWEVLDMSPDPVPVPSNLPGARNPTTPAGMTEAPRYNVDYRSEVPKCTAPDEGMPKDSWLNENLLGTDSEPIEWFEALMPPSLVQQWTVYTNTKARLMGMGTAQLYPTFKDFTTDEIERFLGLFMLQGLNPSAQISHKFYSQSQDPIAGNNTAHRVFGGHGNGVLRLKHFRCAFAVQDPLLPPPSKKTHPTFKVDPFLEVSVSNLFFATVECMQNTLLV